MIFKYAKLYCLILFDALDSVGFYLQHGLTPFGHRPFIAGHLNPFSQIIQPDTLMNSLYLYYIKLIQAIPHTTRHPEMFCNAYFDSSFWSPQGFKYWESDANQINFPVRADVK